MTEKIPESVKRRRGRPLLTRQQDNIRDLIQTKQLINRLSNYVFGKIKMEKAQVSAAAILLRKTLPDMNHTEVNQNVTVNLVDVIRTIEHKRDNRDLRALEDLSTAIRN